LRIKPMRTIAVAILWMLAAIPAAMAVSADPACRITTVRAHIEVAEGSLSLADVLAPGSCPQLRAAATRVRFGVAPLPGSPRVLDGLSVRRLFEPLTATLDITASQFRIPERVVVERKEATLSGPGTAASSVARRKEKTTDEEPLVKSGQPALLTWEHGGIRVLLQVICLDSGGEGQSVRARTKNSGRILRAEVVGKGSLRVRPEGL
jgi:Chaperone for flagella basal body P-ring formation